MKKKKLLVMGATGFLGKNIYKHFKKNKNYEVVGTCYKSEPFDKYIKQVNLLDHNQVRDIIRDVDIVFQYAAVTSGAKEIVNSPEIHVTDNALMNSIILREVSKSHVQRFVFPSCTVMYQSGENYKKESDFDGEILPKYFGVGWTKVYIEKMCQFFSGICDTKFNVLRQSNLYGPWDKYQSDKSHFFAASVDKVMNKQSDEVIVWGEGLEARDLLYVDDLMDLHEKVLDNEEQFTLSNVGLGESYTVKDVVEKIIKVSGNKKTIKFDKSKPSLNNQLFLNCENANKTFGWSAKTSLEDGIEKTLNWYKNNI